MYAERALYTTYEPDVDAHAAMQALDGARTPAELSLNDAHDDYLERLVNVLAWTRLRLNELSAPDDKDANTLTAELLPWLFAGVALQPSDAVLRAALANRLGNLNLFASAALEAGAAAAAAESGNDYAADSAVTAFANFFGDPEMTGPFIELVSGDDAYRNSVELHMFLTMGDRAKLEAHRRRPIWDDLWARIDHTYATVILDGIAKATPILEELLDATTKEGQSSVLDSVLIATLLRRREDVAVFLARAEDDPEADEADIQFARLVEQFGFEPGISAEEYFSRNLERCDTPAKCALVANVMLPLVAAARAGSAGAVQEVAIDQELLQARLAELEDVRTLSIDELEKLRVGLGSLLVLSDVDAGPADLVAAVAGARAAWPPELSSGAGDRIAQLIVRRSFDDLPRRLVQARLDLGPAVDPADIRSVVDGNSRVTAPLLLSIALLDDSLGAGAREEIANRASADDVGTAARLIRAALGEARSGADSSGASLIADYWAVDALLQAIHDDPMGTTGLRAAATTVRDELTLTLDNLLGLVRESGALLIPAPITVEVGDALVPIVDSAQDGGRFLYDLIPAMRDRILAGTGVIAPGVRMRGNPSLGEDEYSIMIEDVRAVGGTAPLDASYRVVPLGAQEGEPGDEVTDFHPRTGKRGLWSLVPVRDGQDGDGEPPLDPAEYLIHRIEHVLRSRLARLLGPQEAADLVHKWSETDSQLVSAVLPNDSWLKLTWVLQSLLDEGVPIAEWRTLLAAIGDAGGIAAPTPSLVRAARSRLHDILPGSGAGRTVVRVPAELEAALSDTLRDAVTLPSHRHEFQRWLRETVSASGPAIAITLVASDSESRERVSALTRATGGLVATLSEDELAPR